MTKTNIAKQGNTNLTDLDSFRADARAWLEENCPASMRTPAPEDEVVWGGRNAVYKHPDSRIWLDRMAAKGLIHKNKAARHKARLNAHVKALSAA